MGRSDFLIVLTIISLLSPLRSLSSPPSSSSSSSPSIYDVLLSHGLPTGVLPKGITNFTVVDDPAGGSRFEFWLDAACDTKFETHVHYDLHVSGTLGVGEIGQLSGMSAQDLFLWFPVKGIRVDVPSSGIVYFDVGVVRKQFSLSFFETPRDCTAAGPESAPIDLLHPRLQNLDGKFENELDQGRAES